MEEDAFLRAMADDPADEVVRQAYADWLEERADPRAEFLRLERQLRSAPYGHPHRKALGARWRELRASLDRGWAERVGAWALLPPWAPAGTRAPGRGGVRDFDEWMRHSHYEWVILAVLAPVEAVACALIETRGGSSPTAFRSSGRWLPGVPVRGALGHDPVSQLIPLVQLRGHAWTVAMYDTFNLTMRGYYTAQENARALSDLLGTLALEFSTEDTSGAKGYRLYECGEWVEYAEWWSDGETFASKKRLQPPWGAIPEYYPDELFRSLGLYIPAFYAREDTDGPGVVLDGLPADEVDRADLLHLREWFTDQAPALRLRDEFPVVHVLRDEHAIYEESPDDSADNLPSEDDIPF